MALKIRPGFAGLESRRRERARQCRRSALPTNVSKMVGLYVSGGGGEIQTHGGSEGCSIERTKVPPLFKFIGLRDEFAEHAQARIDASSNDSRDMPLVVKAVRRWVDE